MQSILISGLSRCNSSRSGYIFLQRIYAHKPSAMRHTEIQPLTFLFLLSDGERDPIQSTKEARNLYILLIHEYTFNL